MVIVPDDRLLLLLEMSDEFDGREDEAVATAFVN